MTQSSQLLKHAQLRRTRRKFRSRKNIHGTRARLRLVVYRSNRHIYAQIVDDDGPRTITGCSTLTPALKDKLAAAANQTGRSRIVGEHLAAIATAKGVSQVVFDRNGRKYHGRVKALADGARNGGLEF